MRRRLAPVVLALVAACAGCPGQEAPRRTEADAAGLAALDSSLASFIALDRVGEERRIVTWGEDPFRVVRRQEGWERLDGAAHARLVTANHDLPTFVVEWLRPAGDRVLCAARSTTQQVRRLVPPQPILVAPLEEGRAWSWSGLVGDRPAEADFRILHVGERDGARVLEVEQTTRAGGLSSTRVQTWVAGRGLVDERGTMPTSDQPGGKVYETKGPRPEEWP